MKSKLGVLEDTMELAKDNNDFTAFRGKLDDLELTSVEMEMINDLEKYFDGVRANELIALYHSLKNDSKVAEVQTHFDSP